MPWAKPSRQLPKTFHHARNRARAHKHVYAKTDLHSRQEIIDRMESA